MGREAAKSLQRINLRRIRSEAKYECRKLNALRNAYSVSNYISPTLSEYMLYNAYI
jgi:hypothetical protein